MGNERKSFKGKPIYQRISLSRSFSSYDKVRRLYGALLRGRWFQATRPSIKSKKYLNVGCGPNMKPQFINLDYRWMPGIDVCWDVRKGLPFEDKSLAGIYSEHCLEHLSFDDCSDAIREFRRVLEPNGFVRIVVPDAELYFDLYQRHKAGEEVAFPYAPSPLPEEQTALMAINPIFFDHGHLYAYDASTLGMLLERAGFKDIKKESFMYGRDSALLIDSEDRAVESLYMEACA